MHDGAERRDPTDVEDQEHNRPLPSQREEAVDKAQGQLLQAREQGPYPPRPWRLRASKPSHSRPVSAPNTTRNAPLHARDEGVALSRQVLVEMSIRAIICRRRSSVSTLPSSRLDGILPLDAGLDIRWRVRGSHRGPLLAGFTIGEWWEKGDACSQTSLETLLKSCGLISAD